MKGTETLITVNGREELVCLPCTVAEVLDKVGLKVTQVVVERNGKVLSKAVVSQTIVCEGDRLEVIVPVAGVDTAGLVTSPNTRSEPPRARQADLSTREYPDLPEALSP